MSKRDDNFGTIAQKPFFRKIYQEKNSECLYAFR